MTFLRMDDSVDCIDLVFGEGEGGDITAQTAGGASTMSHTSHYLKKSGFSLLWHRQQEGGASMIYNVPHDSRVVCLPPV